MAFIEAQNRLITSCCSVFGSVGTNQNVTHKMEHIEGKLLKEESSHSTKS